MENKMAQGYLRVTRISQTDMSSSVGRTLKRKPQSGFFYGMEAAAQNRR